MRPNRRRIDWLALAAGALVAYALGGFVLYPLASVFLDSFRASDGGLTFEHYTEAFGFGSRNWRALFNTLWISVAGTAGAAVIGTALALAMARVRVPGSRALSVILLLPLALPPIVGVLAFKLLAGQDIGWLHRLARELGMNVTLAGWGGVLVVHVYSLYVYYLLFVGAALARASGTPVEAARTLGAGPWRAFWAARWPAIRPAFAGATLLCLMISAASFSAPFLFATDRDVLALNLYNARSLNREGELLVLAVVMTVLSLGFLAWSRWLHRRAGDATATRGVPQPPRALTNRGARALAGLSASALALLVLLPFVTIAVFAFSDTNARNRAHTILPPEYGLDNFRAIVADPRAWRPIQTSLEMAGIATAACLVFGLLAAWLMRSRRRSVAAAIDLVVMLPWALPAIVVAVNLIRAFNTPTPFAFGTVLVNTFWVLPVAYFVRFVPLVARASYAALSQVEPSAVEAARTLGASRARAAWHVIFPLMWPGVAAGVLLTFVTALGEFVSSYLLYTARTEPIGVKIYSIYTGAAAIGPACAYSLLLVGLVVVVLIVARRVLRVDLSASLG